MPVILLGGLPGVTPDAVAGLQGWWKADAGVYHTTGPDVDALDGETVVKWADQSGNSRHLVTGTAPTFKTAIVNGRPVIRFVAASSQVLSTTGFAVSTLVANNAYTILCVLKKATSGALDGHWYAHDNIAGANAIGVASDTNDDLAVQNYDGTPDAVIKAASLAAAFNTLTAMHSGGNIYAGVSDTRDASLASAASGNTSVLTEVFNVGRNFGGYGSFDIAELAIYNVAVSEADRQNIERYLAFKYGITLPY